jgi:hypothetical protein
MMTIAETNGKRIIPVRRCLQKEIDGFMVYEVVGKRDTGRRNHHPAFSLGLRRVWTCCVLQNVAVPAPSPLLILQNGLESRSWHDREKHPDDLRRAIPEHCAIIGADVVNSPIFE